MWNLSSSSKLTQDRIQSKSYDQHLKRLQKMQSSIKIKPPIHLNFVYSKNKLEMSRKDRIEEIDRQNEILLKKMMNIDKKCRKKSIEKKKSLNRQTRNMMRNIIEQDNRRMCDKLIKVEPFYRTSEFQRNAESMKILKMNISTNARRQMTQRSQRAQSARPRSGITTVASSTRIFRRNTNENDRYNTNENERSRYNRPDSAANFRVNQQRYS